MSGFALCSRTYSDPPYPTDCRSPHKMLDSPHYLRHHALQSGATFKKIGPPSNFVQKKLLIVKRLAFIKHLVAGRLSLMFYNVTHHLVWATARGPQM